MTGTNGSGGPGTRLKEARVAIDVKTREVADALNLPVNVIEAIEADAYESLPAPVFTRGYIRAYAKLLDLDVEPLVASYQPAEIERSESLLMDQPAKLRLHRNVGPVIGGSVALVIVLILVVITVVWPSSESPDEVQEDVRPEAVEPDGRVDLASDSTAPIREAVDADTNVDADANLATDELVEIGSMSAAATQPSAAATQPSAAATQPSNSSLPNADSSSATIEDATLDQADMSADIATAAPRVVAPVATPATRTRRLTPAGDDRLMLAFTEECWVEVKGLGGGSLYSNLSRAGTELQLIGSGPFRVLLGYAPGATLAFNGETVPLAPHTRNNVASLMIGQ